MTTPAVSTHHDSAATDPRTSSHLMVATYAVGAVTLALSFFARGSDATTAAYWAAAGCVGSVGLLSFVRHSVFHRSDAARMGWDYGRRNDFQIEVGLANLAWGVVGILSWALGWGAAAAGAVVLSYGIYMAGAAAMHVGELRHHTDGEPPRFGAAVASSAFAVMLVVAGAMAVTA